MWAERVRELFFQGELKEERMRNISIEEEKLEHIYYEQKMEEDQKCNHLPNCKLRHRDGY